MIESVVQQLGGGVWLTKLPALRATLASCSLTRRDTDELITKALDEAHKNHKGRALNFFGLALVWNQGLALEIVRKRGSYAPPLLTWIRASRRLLLRNS